MIPTTDSHHLRQPNRTIVLHGLAAVALVCIYMLLWWNRSLAANSVLLSDAQDFLAGKFPYRDFYLFTTPVNLLVKTGLVWLSGNSVALLRAYGVLERLVMVALTYWWISRRCSAFSSFFGSVAMGISSLGATSEMLFHYNFQAITFSLIAGIAVDHLFDRNRSYLASLALAAVAGCFTCLAFFAKQPTGVIVSVAVALFVILLYRDKVNRSHPVTIGFSFIGGWLVPFLLFVLWLYAHQALAASIDQTLISGPTAKGPLWSVLLRPLILTLHSRTLIASSVIAILLLLSLVALTLRLRVSAIPFWSGEGSKWFFWIPAALAIAGGVVLSSVPAKGREDQILDAFQFVFIYLCQFSCALAMLWYANRWRKQPLTSSEMQTWFTVYFCSALIYSFTLSYPVFGIMFVPVLAFLVAYVLDYARIRRSGFVFGLICASCLALIATEVCHKFITPYSWDIWIDSPVWAATTESRIPELKGLYLGPKHVEFLEKVTADIVNHSMPGDPVLVFPSLPLLYSLSDRRPNTFSDTHFTDTTPDSIALSDGLRIAKSPPKVIVLIETQEDQFSIQEKMYRAQGTLSGQRRLRDRIRAMVENYDLVDSLTIPLSGVPVKVFVRRG